MHYAISTTWGATDTTRASLPFIFAESALQAGDTVVIIFNDATAGTTIDASNIDSAMILSNSHSWKDGSGAIGAAAWSTTTYTDDWCNRAKP